MRAVGSSWGHTGIATQGVRSRRGTIFWNLTHPMRSIIALRARNLMTAWRIGRPGSRTTSFRTDIRYAHGHSPRVGKGALWYAKGFRDTPGGRVVGLDVACRASGGGYLSRRIHSPGPPGIGYSRSHISARQEERPRPGRFAVGGLRGPRSSASSRAWQPGRRAGWGLMAPYR